MTYNEAIRFWYGRINYEVRAARPEDLKLERMAALLSALGNPQNAIGTIHIAGTKGKGSTAAMIAALARTGGRKTGLFTSPHLERVEERIQVDSVPISEAELAAGMTALRPVVEALDAHFPPVTFFEIVTALGWLHFRNCRVDLAILEVGLGGRFDSTNVCSPLATVITSIGPDHMAQLGNTLEEIAYQKAGIIKSGRPVISGVTQPGPRNVIVKEAEKLQAPLIEVTEPYTGPLRLLGEHQRRNAALAIAACEAAGLPLSSEKTNKALADLRWPARIELVRRDPAVILDCAHNVPSVQALVTTLQAEFPNAKQRVCIFAVSNDKQFELMMPILAVYFTHFILTKYGLNPRCVPPETLKELLPEHVSSTIITPASAAYEHALKTSDRGDLICITGSVFLAGELKPRL